MRHRYTSATRTHTWHFDGRNWVRAAFRADAGYADTTSIDGGFLIVAASSETPGKFEEPSESLRELFDVIAAGTGRAAATIRSHQSSIECDAGIASIASDIVTISIRAPRVLSFTARVDRAMAAAGAVMRFANDSPEISVEARDYPIVWRNGSGAVLLHEAVGHPSELATDPLLWPRWLEVVDDPEADGIGTMQVDDVGVPAQRRTLSSGEQPAAHRRSGYRDVPLRRLTNVTVRHNDDDFDEPESRIEVFLVGRGHYDALRDAVELRVDVADLVTRERRIAIAPFAIVEPREKIAMRLLGARGRAVEYPGVICSREGQRLAVGSFAPDLLTDAFA